MRLADQLFRLALRLYPASYRARFGAELSELFRDTARDERHRTGWSGIVRLTGRTLVDLGRDALVERRRVRAGLRPYRESARRGPVLDAWRQDLSFALRLLRRAPGFTLVVMLTMALGVGANTAIFAAVNAALLEPLPYPHADRLVVAEDLAPAPFLQWRAGSRAFAAMAAWRFSTFSLTGVDRPERLEGLVVNASFLAVLGVRPALGRGFLPEDEQAGSARVAVISDGVWRTDFGGDPKLVGRAVTLNGERVTVIGVMPAGFAFPSWAQVWASPRRIVPEYPLRPNADATRMYNQYLSMIGRLADGYGLADARVEQRMLFGRMREAHPDLLDENETAVTLVTLRDALVAGVRPALLMLFAAVGIVLLMGCVNIASLLLARSTVRRQEMAVRAALGASRSRLARQVLTESLVLSLLGGAVGTAGASWYLPALMALAPADLQRVHPALDWPVLAVALGVSIAAGLVFGLAPAVEAAGEAGALRSQGRVTSGRRGRLIRDALVVGEVAVCLALVVAAALMVQSFIRLRAVNPGFQTGGRFTARIDLPAERYNTGAAQARFFDGLLARLAGTPGIEGVAAAGRLPFAGGNSSRGVTLDHAPPVADPSAGIRVVSPGFFRTLGVPLRHGRPFTYADRDGAAPVAVVNETMARRFWPNEEALGHRFRIGDTGPWMDVVGIAGDVIHDDLRDGPDPEFYVPYRQVPWRFMNVVIEAPAPADVVAADLRQAVAAMDPDLPVPTPRAMTDLVASSLSLDRFETLLLTLFAGVALVLAVVGLYGVMSFLVSRRTREMALRLALGASRAELWRLVLFDGLRLAVTGIAGGLLLSFVLDRALATWLFGVAPTDPLTFVGTSAGLALVAALASAVPARRAMRVDPMVSFRTE